MKKSLLLFSLILSTAFLLTGCLDTEEDVTINSNGSGIYKTSIDMSGLFDMMQMAAMMDTSANSQLKQLGDKNIDSTIAIGAFTDTSSTLTAEERALLHDGTMHMTINQHDKVFKIVLNYPFKKTEDIQKIMELQQSGKGFDPLGKAKSNPALQGLEGDGDGEKGGGLPSADQYAKTTFKNGVIERKVDQSKIDSLKNSEQFGQMQAAGDMLLSGITFTTTIHLPKAVKSSSGSKLTVSDDKKTVRMKYTLGDMIKTPKSLEFKVEY
jgi:hypothetical protein